ncbi:hypothetical protein DIE04_26920 [Burkholderia sp. Bp8994]|nr:hypothetical protein DIE20_26485 [Burkholderia sp. Bp9131]RQR73409.1 hypothetical protein DIE12_14055 [Burkholderia sp. Bp9015]RQR82042.1 hypothetical protein DIE10_16015 [Burkholderia sp. Bp9011]RQR90907.1 hypothetical protein DIE04_26920 [Burkholderia sp. Bp8994]RQR91673.1 hypothetical protein DIE09_18250 [Burkholderia sp. Bp9010]RQS00275.1 hypothetical protein DIE02_27990 [Burkholderia sp. Bp8991]RQS29187.1 hypothetical protein DIE05_14475 [Burkholderia sp. Bp8995]RQS38452.1 hypothetic
MQTTPAWGTVRRGVWRRGVPCGSATGHVAVRPDNRVDHIGQRSMLQCNIFPIFHQTFAN